MVGHGAEVGEALIPPVRKTIGPPLLCPLGNLHQLLRLLSAGAKPPQPPQDPQVPAGAAVGSGALGSSIPVAA